MQWLPGARAHAPPQARARARGSRTGHTVKHFQKVVLFVLLHFLMCTHFVHALFVRTFCSLFAVNLRNALCRPRLIKRKYKLQLENEHVLKHACATFCARTFCARPIFGPHCVLLHEPSRGGYFKTALRAAQLRTSLRESSMAPPGG